MTAPLDLNNALIAAQDAYIKQVADIRASFANPPAPEIKLVGKAPGASVNLLGSAWSVQSGTPDGVSLSEDGSVLGFKAKSGDRASFDPARKIRAELGDSRTFGKGEPIALKGSIWVDPATAIVGSEWCSVMQIHQADTRRADGVPVTSAPMFSAELSLKDGGTFLRMRAETGRGVPVQNVFPSPRILAEVPFSLGVEHQFEYVVVDGHGYDGSVKFTLDGKTVVDFSGPTGFEYVDLLASAYLVRGQPQSTRSYRKIGIYAGKGSGSSPPDGVVIGYRFKLTL